MIAVKVPMLRDKKIALVAQDNKKRDPMPRPTKAVSTRSPESLAR
jgi:hypothetical protein